MEENVKSKSWSSISFVKGIFHKITVMLVGCTMHNKLKRTNVCIYKIASVGAPQKCFVFYLCCKTKRSQPKGIEVNQVGRNGFKGNGKLFSQSNIYVNSIWNDWIYEWLPLNRNGVNQSIPFNCGNLHTICKVLKRKKVGFL